MSTIGFIGGSFNPPTNAHINMAEQVIKECKLDKVIFVPVGDFYEKNELIEFKHRYNMLKLICNNNENLEVSDIENVKSTKLYAIDVFEIIRKKYSNDDIYYIMGSDNLEKIKNWKDYNKLITNYKHIILERTKDNFNDIVRNNIEIKENIKNFKLVTNYKYMGISSSLVREKVCKNEDFSELIPNVIKEYILKNNLYTKS